MNIDTQGSMVGYGVLYVPRSLEALLLAVLETFALIYMVTTPYYMPTSEDWGSVSSPASVSPASR